MKHFFFPIVFLLFVIKAQSQTDPMITSWWFNTTNQTYTGTNGTIKVDVDAVYYTTTLVYVKSSGVPNYYLDDQSLFDAKDMTNVFKLPRTQTVATTATRTYLRDEGAIGVFIDGSVFLSPGDGKTYNSAGVWHQLAYKFEGNDFDTTNGHSTPSGQYHHHVAVEESNLNSLTDSSTHSPLIGYAFDGYPVYGPYGYTNVNGTGAIKRMESSWNVRNITTRTTLPDGSTASSAGPTIGNPPSGQPLGKYYEDYEYVVGSGDLDQYNGRFCVTPEYPSGTYCYFTTLDSSLNPEFPYFVGDYFYGVVQSGNMGPTGGNNTVPSSATQFDPSILSSNDNIFEKVQIKIFPNPVVDFLKFENTSADAYEVNIYNMTGAIIYESELKGQEGSLDMSNFASGNYVIEFINKISGDGYMKRIIKN